MLVVAGVLLHKVFKLRQRSKLPHWHTISYLVSCYMWCSNAISEVKQYTSSFCTRPFKLWLCRSKSTLSVHQNIPTCTTDLPPLWAVKWHSQLEGVTGFTHIYSLFFCTQCPNLLCSETITCDQQPPVSNRHVRADQPIYLNSFWMATCLKWPTAVLESLRKTPTCYNDCLAIK